MNCKPGDIARCIFDDHYSPSNVGRQCLVLPDTPGEHEAEVVRRCEREHGQMWRVQTLEAWYAHRPDSMDDLHSEPRVLEMPGSLLWVADCRLQRIDPPAEDITQEEVDQLYAPGPVLIPLQVKGEVH